MGSKLPHAVKNLNLELGDIEAVLCWELTQSYDGHRQIFSQSSAVF